MQFISASSSEDEDEAHKELDKIFDELITTFEGMTVFIVYCLVIKIWLKH